MTQNEYLLNYLQKGNTITAHEAATQHGILQLGRCLDDLRKEGHHIRRRWIDAPTRHGEGTVKVKEYWLAEAEVQGSMFDYQPKSKAYEL